MKIALFGTNQLQFGKVYTPEVLNKLSQYGELSEKINQSNLKENADFLKDCEYAFSTWGMPKFTKEEIKYIKEYCFFKQYSFFFFKTVLQ